MITNHMDAQPFIAHVRRLSEVMRMLGIPVSKDVTQAIKESSHVDDTVAIRRIMQALDTQCAAFVTLNAADSGDVIAAKRTPNLIENGWTPLLVKVINNVDRLFFSQNLRYFPGIWDINNFFQTITHNTTNNRQIIRNRRCLS